MGEQGMACRSIEQPLPKRPFAIFFYGQARRIDIGARSPLVEIVPVCVVSGMLPAPIRVGREREQAAYHPHQIVRSRRGKKGTVAAIVLDNENTNEQAARW
jgi:hypothetical protein